VAAAHARTVRHCATRGGRIRAWNPLCRNPHRWLHGWHVWRV